MCRRRGNRDDAVEKIQSKRCGPYCNCSGLGGIANCCQIRVLLDENSSHELAVCRQEKKTSGKPSNNCGSVVCPTQSWPETLVLYRTRPAGPSLPAHSLWGASDTALGFLGSLHASGSQRFADKP